MGRKDALVKYRENGLDNIFLGDIGCICVWAADGLQSVPNIRVRIGSWFTIFHFENLRSYRLFEWLFRNMMHMDAAMTTLTKNDGIVSLLHCQERNYKEDFVLKFDGQSLNTTSASECWPTYGAISENITIVSQKVVFYVVLCYLTVNACCQFFPVCCETFPVCQLFSELTCMRNMRTYQE